MACLGESRICASSASGALCVSKRSLQRKLNEAMAEQQKSRSVGEASLSVESGLLVVGLGL